MKAYGRLSILGPSKKKNGRVYKKVQCICGSAPIWIEYSNLKSGHSRSCGCYSQELKVKRLKTHGLSGHHLYGRYIELISRCTNPDNTDFSHYGGKGVTVCERWSDSLTGFQCFLEDMESTYTEGMTIDRIDPNGPYSPENCRWLSMDDQQRNKTNNHFRVGSQEYYSWSNLKRVKGSYIERWNDFKEFYKDLGPKPASARLRRHDRKKQHGPNNSYWG